MAGRKSQAAVHEDRSDEDRCRRDHAGHLACLRATLPHPARGRERGAGGDRDGRTLRHALAVGPGSHPASRYPARDGQSRRSESLPRRILWRAAFDTESQGSETRHRGFARSPQFRAVAGTGQVRRTRRGRPARRAHRRLVAAIRLRTARVGHPSGTAPRHEPGAIPHRRHHAQGVRIPERGDDRRDRARQDSRPHGSGRETPPAGRPHQNALDRGPRSGTASVDHADRVRRKSRHAYLRSRHCRKGIPSARLFDG